MKKVLKILGFVVSMFLFIGCLASCENTPEPTEPPKEETPVVEIKVDQKEEIYKLAISSGYSGTYGEWLNSINGNEIELSYQNNYIVWKYKSENNWRQLASLTSLQGSVGQDGKRSEFRINDGYLEWKHTVDSEWVKLYKLTFEETNEPTNSTDEETITVTFVIEWTDKGNSYEIVKSVERKVKAGLLTAPLDLVPEGKYCENWLYYDKYDKKYIPWKFNLYNASEDVTLFGLFVEEYTITFLDEDGNKIKDVNATYTNGLKIESYSPKKQGANFVCWVDEENSTEFYYVGDYIYPTKDVALKPVISIDYYVTYMTEAGAIYKVETVSSLNPYASKLSYIPSKSGYVCAGWALNGVLFDFSNPISSNITLTPILSEARTIELVYSGSASNQEFNISLLEDFKNEMRRQGDPHTYNITYVQSSVDRVDSQILDWRGIDAPDVYEFTSDKIANLYKKGALSELTGVYKQFIDTELNEFAKTCATLNDSYYAYPYTGNNTYYLQYDKSKITSEQAKDMIKLMDAASARGLKVGYNIGEGFWGAGAMFTFGADYNIRYTDEGYSWGVTADFNGSNGMKAAKAILEIVNHPAWKSTSSVPGQSDNVCAVIGGTWDIAGYKALWGNNYACAVMPTVTVDGETKHLGAFLGGQLIGVNPLRSSNDTERLEAAHKLAKFLAGKECQLKRFEHAEIAPCHIEAGQDPKVQASPNAAVLAEQGTFAHAQTSVPDGVWAAPGFMVTAMKDGECTLDNLQDYLDEFNKTVIGKGHDCEGFTEWELVPGKKCEYTGYCTLCKVNVSKSTHEYFNNICKICGGNYTAIGSPIKADEPMAIYVKAPSNWDSVNCYYWCDLQVGVQGDGSEIAYEEHVGMWPGLPMTLVDKEENIWGFIIPRYTNMIIFNCEGVSQTIDLELVSSNFYVLNDMSDASGKYTVLEYDTYYDESGLTLNQYPSKDIIIEYEYRTIYVQTPEDWSSVKICFWETALAPWPEYDNLEVVDASQKIYKYTLPSIVSTIILSDGEGKDTQEIELKYDKDFIIIEDLNDIYLTEYYY